MSRFKTRIDKLEKSSGNNRPKVQIVEYHNQPPEEIKRGIEKLKARYADDPSIIIKDYTGDVRPS